MAANPQPAGPNSRPGLFVQLERFWQRVTEGLELGELWKQFHADARASYRLYRRDFDARSPRESRKHNFFQTAQEFAWALLEKLTPARRILLLFGVVLLVFPAGGFSYHGKAGEVEVVEFDFRFYGGILLFVVLLLETADRVVMKRDLEIARDIQSWLLRLRRSPDCKSPLPLVPRTRWPETTTMSSSAPLSNRATLSLPLPTSQEKASQPLC